MSEQLDGYEEIKRRHTEGDGPSKPSGSWPLPTIVVRAGDRHLAADAGLKALEAAGTQFFQRSGSLVYVCPIEVKTTDGETTLAPGIEPVSHPMLGRELGRATHWVRFDANGREHRTDPPKAVVEQIAVMVREWPFPTLAGVIGTPTLRRDGSILTAQGYDSKTGLVLLGGPDMPPIPAEPTRHDALTALTALALLDRLLDEFPFADANKGDQSVNRAVALSSLLTPVARGALGPVPLHLVTAPQSGTGKSFLADIASAIATGERCGVLSASPKPDETDKRLIGAALSGVPIIALDNCVDTIEGAFICQLTERPLLKLRPLGTSDDMLVPNTFTVFANGNNATIAGDMVRRTIQCVLDANVENPEEREFRSDPIAMIKADRGAYVAAVLTILRAYICAGQPRQVKRLPSYAPWSDLIRSALVWLGRPDPVSTMTATRSGDPVRMARATVYTAWAAELGLGSAYRTADLIKFADKQGDLFGNSVLRDTLLDVAPVHGRRDQIDPRRLGRWLNDQTNTIANGLKLAKDLSDRARPRYILGRAETN
jgi:putative DNA primase/helicase